MLITGGTGTFGNAVLRRFVDSQVSEIRIFSRDEKKQEDMRLLFNNPKLRFYVGDVRDYKSVYDAAAGVDIVFHAAALKQVPSCEFYPMEALRTNAIGADNVMNASITQSVKKVILLSTDKAVYPINAMGISKAMMEKLMVAKARLKGGNATVICGIRYGNVMTSRGSVIPLFINQIKERRPLTITDPRMTRFMMSIDDAVNLVLYAHKNAKAGDIFVQKAPAATLATLAEALTKIFESTSGTTVIGTRHGEKLYETLLTREEMARAEDLGEFYRIPADTRDLNYSLYYSEGQESISHEQDYNSHNTKQLGVNELVEMLMKLDYVQDELKSWR